MGWRQRFFHKENEFDMMSITSMETSGEYPRVLIVSHNPLHEYYNNGMVCAKLFKGWPVQSLAQLYFVPRQPGSNVCTNYWRVTEIDIINRIFRYPFRKSCGHNILLNSPVDDGYEEVPAEQKGYALVRRFRKVGGDILRELFWHTDIWRDINMLRW